MLNAPSPVCWIPLSHHNSSHPPGIRPERSLRAPGLAAAALLGLWLAGHAVRPRPAYADTRPNVLFLVIDDLRPELGCYGERHIVTPNNETAGR